MDAPRVSPETLGAWLIKGNADRADLAARFARDPRVEGWCVRPGYRARLMAAGQPVVFWASGRRGSGLWGRGVVTGPPEPEGDTWRVPLEVTVEPPEGRLPRRDLRADPRLAGAEVFRQPQGSNPSFLTPAEYAALLDHLGEGPP